MKRRSIMVFLLVIVLIFSTLISGCGTDRDQSSGSNNQGNANEKISTEGKEDEAADEQSGNEEPITVVFAPYTMGAFDEENTVVEKAMEEKFPGVDVVFWPLERATWTQQLATRIAGGDIPDYFQVFDKDSLIQQEIIAEIPLEDIKTYMPGYYKEALEYGADVFLATYYEGKNYGLPLLSYTNIYPFTSAYRQDWLEAVGIDKVPETLEDMEAALRAFTFNDPDGNGVDDTIGYAPQGMGGSIRSVFSEVYGAFGVLPDKWMMMEDGTLRLGATTPQAKEALAVLQKWYKEGIIDKEFITIDGKIATQKWANGIAGYMSTTWYRWIPGGEHAEALLAVNPNAAFAISKAPKGPDGSYGYNTWDKIGNAYCISVEAKEDTKKYHKILEMVETIGFQDQELYHTLKFGIKGQHWAPDPETQVPTFIEPYNVVESRGPLGTNTALLTKPASSQFLWSEYGNLTDTYMIYNDLTTIVAGEDFIEWPNKLLNPDITQKYQEDANAALDKLIINIITGANSIDDFDSLVAEWEKAGGAKLMEEYNRAYQENKDLVKQFLSLN